MNRHSVFEFIIVPSIFEFNHQRLIRRTAINTRGRVSEIFPSYWRKSVNSQCLPRLFVSASSCLRLNVCLPLTPFPSHLNPTDDCHLKYLLPSEPRCVRGGRRRRRHGDGDGRGGGRGLARGRRECARGAAARNAECRRHRCDADDAGAC
jgi:hypothetical protein